MAAPVPFRLSVIALALLLGLAACQSSEERAEKHYQSGLELLAAGDVDRAILEFRNALKLDANNPEVRRSFAQVERARGNLRQAYGHYLYIAEGFPDDREARVALAEIAFEMQDWEEFERHAPKAAQLASGDPEGQAIETALAYRRAALDDDAPARRAALARAEDLRGNLPDSPLLRRVRLDGYLQERNFEAALAELDELLQAQPDNRQALDMRLQILAQMGDMDAVAAQLLDMVRTFPTEPEILARLVRFHLYRADYDAAEAVLRETADATAENPVLYIDLVRFLFEIRGPNAAETALAEGIAAREAAGRSAAAFKALQVGMAFNGGDRAGAIARMEEIVTQAEAEDARESVEELGRLKVTLARMQQATGNEVAARQLVEAVLAADASNGDALKMRARWQIADDEVDGAVATLRMVLDAAPEDAEAMTLMAEAHTRAGNHELARDFLSLAVEASGRAPAESIRYAQRLIAEGRTDAAEAPLIAALRLAPDNEQLLVALGQLYVKTGDMPRATQVADTLRRVGTDSAKRAADVLQAEILRQSQGIDQAIEYLDQVAASGDLGARTVAVRARLAAGDTAGAVTALEAALTETPDNLQLRLLQGTVKMALGDLTGAETDYRALVADRPDLVPARLQLARLLFADGRADAARATIEDGLAAAPGSPDLLWAKASYLERDGDIDSAIALYETLYERLSNSPIVANNLASLLATWREDDESLARAHAVARRLRGTEVPAFQDTYGWILQRRGETAEALTYLEPAANSLANDPIVQYHLGVAYRALGRETEALRQFEKAVALVGEIDTRPQIEEARAEVVRLRAAGAE